MNIRKMLETYSREVEINLTEKMILDFNKYNELLLEWNEKMNLTAITDVEGIAIKHFIDSLVPAKYFKDNSSIIDVGIGAGFPTIPLKIYNNTLKVTGLDSVNKKLTFLKAVEENLGLTELSFIHGRAEDIAQKKEYREQYQYATARAVASLNVLSELCLPFLAVGGKFIVYKGEKWKEELQAGERAIETLGGQVIKTLEYTLPEINDKRSIIIIEKVKRTPNIYPRKAGVPAKKPLTN